MVIKQVRVRIKDISVKSFFDIYNQNYTRECYVCGFLPCILVPYIIHMMMNESKESRIIVPRITTNIIVYLPERAKDENK